MYESVNELTLESTHIVDVKVYIWLSLKNLMCSEAGLLKSDEITEVG